MGMTVQPVDAEPAHCYDAARISSDTRSLAFREITQ